MGFGDRLTALSLRASRRSCSASTPIPPACGRRSDRAGARGNGSPARRSGRRRPGAVRQRLIDAVGPACVAVKPQLAFFEQAGHHGLAAAERVAELARERGLLVIADGKRGDIGSTAEAYALGLPRAAARSPPLADALTVNPYLGARLAGAVRGRLPGRRRR